MRPFVLPPPPSPSILGRVLLVEDNLLNRELALRELPMFEIDCAVGDAQAFALLRESAYDLLLVDVGLPRSILDGYRIVRVLRGNPDDWTLPTYAMGVALPPDVPVIFVTAFSSYTRRSLLAAGASDVFWKPVDYERLALRMAHLLNDRARSCR